MPLAPAKRAQPRLQGSVVGHYRQTVCIYSETYHTPVPTLDSLVTYYINSRVFTCMRRLRWPTLHNIRWQTEYKCSGLIILFSRFSSFFLLSSYDVQHDELQRRSLTPNTTTIILLLPEWRKTQAKQNTGNPSKQY